VIVLVADYVVEFEDRGVDQVGDEKEDEERFGTIAGVEGVVPCGFSVTNEYHGFFTVGIFFASVVAFEDPCPGNLSPRTHPWSFDSRDWW